jgi:leader peptidase (prepilin peptidase)/N-methyltransferase
MTTAEERGDGLEDRVLSPIAGAATAFLATLLAFAAIGQAGFGARGLINAFACAVLVVLAAIDIDRHLLPNRIVLPAAAIVLGGQVIFFPEHWLASIGAALGAAALFAGARLVYPAGLGMGDVKLALLLGAVLGTAVLPALTLGTFAAGVFGLVLLARGGAAARKTAIPFGPFLGFGAVVVLLFG